MVIRFPNFVDHGGVQHQAGSVLILPDEFALVHIDAGHAVEVPEAEAAVMHRYVAPPIATVFPPRTALMKRPKGRR